MDHIYIICSRENESDRYDYLSNFFKQNPPDIKISFVEPYYKGIAHDFYKKYDVSLRDGEKCLLETYDALLKHILHNTTYDNVCIFESDVIFLPNFWNNFNNVLENYEKVYSPDSMVFLSNGCNLEPDNIAKVTDVLYGVTSTRCTDSMILTRGAIQKLHNYTNNYINDVIDCPVDFLWNKCIIENNICSYWVHPHICLNGSAQGIYNSNIR
jgi:hypothetical protein